jgi:hypothetical protein
LDPVSISIAIAAVVAGAVFFAVWDWVRDSVSAWIRANFGEASKVMDAWVQFTRIGNRVKLAIRAIIPRRFLPVNRTVTITEDREIPIEELNGPERQRFDSVNSFRVSALHYFR